MAFRKHTMRLLNGTRDQKVEAAVAIAIWVSVCGFTLSTANYYLQHISGLSDEMATVIGAVAGLLGGLKFSA